MDFTITQYRTLLGALHAEGYSFQTFAEFIHSPKLKAIVLRHDVDKLSGNSLRFARIQVEMDIKGSYYFRAVPESWDEKIIKKIANLGHEVGYHYETMDKSKGDIDKAWDDFRFNLEKLRKIVDVKTICMHGSPRSKFDNRTLWEKYDYRSLGIIGEPYYDIDFDEVFYLTDTGRRWDGWKVSIRDKVPQQEQWNKEGLIFHSTNDIIKIIKENKLPNKIMMTFHPQRWTDNPLLWIKERVLQTAKNQVKKILINKK